MPRPKGPPKVQWAIQIPEDLAAQIELLLTDPVRGEPPRGVKSDLVVSLLHEWLARRRGSFGARNQAPPAPSGPHQKEIG